MRLTLLALLAAFVATAGSAAAEDTTFTARWNDKTYAVTVSDATGQVTADLDGYVLTTGPLADVPKVPVVTVIVDTRDPSVGLMLGDERVI